MGEEKWRKSDKFVSLQAPNILTRHHTLHTSSLTMILLKNYHPKKIRMKRNNNSSYSIHSICFRSKL